MIVYCKLCSCFMQSGTFEVHKCTQAVKNNPYTLHKTPKSIGIELNERTSAAAVKYLGAKHELEIWNKKSRDADFDKLRIRVKRLRKITFSLMEGKSMKQAKKVIF